MIKKLLLLSVLAMLSGCSDTHEQDSIHLEAEEANPLVYPPCLQK